MIDKKTLQQNAQKAKTDTKSALQIVKNEEVKKIFDLYGVEYD